jgi:hypothetical protein
MPHANEQKMSDPVGVKIERFERVLVENEGPRTVPLCRKVGHPLREDVPLPRRAPYRRHSDALETLRLFYTMSEMRRLEQAEFVVRLRREHPFRADRMSSLGPKAEREELP